MNKAAEQGEKRAMINLAAINMGSFYPKADINIAVKWHKRLAYEYNDPDSMIELGILYCMGDLIERNHSEGMKLIEEGLSKLGDNIDPYINQQLGFLYYEGMAHPEGGYENRTPADCGKAAEFLEKAIAGGINDEYTIEAKNIAKKCYTGVVDWINKTNQIIDTIINT
jgi:TPR repeat protein